MSSHQRRSDAGSLKGKLTDSVPQDLGAGAELRAVVGVTRPQRFTAKLVETHC
jgi:hypothetical protein